MVLPFCFGTNCSCVYHMGCLEKHDSCIYHNSSLFVSPASECIIPKCKIRHEGICNHCSQRITTSLVKLLTNLGFCLSIRALFVETFRIKSIWPASIIKDVSENAVSPGGLIQRMCHPIIMQSWPNIWQSIRNSVEFVVDNGKVWIGWYWIEQKLLHHLPRIIPYSAVPKMVDGVSVPMLVSFRTAIGMGKSKRFQSINKDTFCRRTKYSCHTLDRLQSVIVAADYAGVLIADLMAETEHMDKMIRTLIDRGHAFVVNEYIYSTGFLKRVKEFDRFSF